MAFFQTDLLLLPTSIRTFISGWGRLVLPSTEYLALLGFFLTVGEHESQRVPTPAGSFPSLAGLELFTMCCSDFDCVAASPIQPSDLWPEEHQDSSQVHLYISQRMLLLCARRCVRCQEPLTVAEDVTKNVPALQESKMRSEEADLFH